MTLPVSAAVVDFTGLYVNDTSSTSSYDFNDANSIKLTVISENGPYANYNNLLLFIGDAYEEQTNACAEFEVADGVSLFSSTSIVLEPATYASDINIYGKDAGGNKIGSGIHLDGVAPGDKRTVTLSGPDFASMKTLRIDMPGSDFNIYSLDMTVIPDNDAPTLTAPDTVSYADTAAYDAFSNTTDTLSASDSDGTISSYGISGGTTGSSSIGGTDYDVSKTGTYGKLYVKSTNGAYAFIPNDAAINAVSSNQGETFTVTATDDDGASGNATLTVSITGGNDTPTGIALSASAVNENVAGNTMVGTLTSTDPDADNTFTYTLVAGTGSTESVPPMLLLPVVPPEMP
ncbi:MAG TPA: VCBS domain-containing protein [Clostridia bacterium]|nr:VCBS domain-containing protein [Clostridia bacterium]